MTLNGWLQILFFLLLVGLVTPAARRLHGPGVHATADLARSDHAAARTADLPLDRRRRTREMRWTEYAVSVLLFSVVSMLVLYAMQRLQGILPFNPQGFGAVAPDLAFNTAVSFTTNTNWQGYGGESTMSYFTQMAGLAYHNFVSAAVGIAVAIAFIRGIAQKEKDTIGNFWVDLTRATLWVLAADLRSSARCSSCRRASSRTSSRTTQCRHGRGREAGDRAGAGRVAGSHQAVRHERRRLLQRQQRASRSRTRRRSRNLLAMFGIFAISSALTYTLGSMTGSRRHGWAVWAAMAFLFLAGVSVAYWAEARGNPLLTAAAPIRRSAPAPGGNMEGKEVRFGIANTALFATVTTDASCGAVNAMHDSFTPLGGLVPLANMQLAR